MRKRKKNSQTHSIEKLQTYAAIFLANGNYKEAIEAYKNLLKKEQREEWQTALAKAYLLRAKALANKNMYKEAAVLWENRANLYEDNEGFDQYLYWLIKAGHYIRAARLFIDSTEQLSDNATRQLTAWFGALLLSGYQDLTEIFPEDSALIKHYALLKNALSAYYQGDDKTTEEYIKKIPFRSPYREFRPIIKALLLIENQPNAAIQILEKVPAESPYARFAALIRILGLPFDALLEALNTLNSQEQAFIASLKGWDKNQLKTISMLQTAAKRDSHKALMEVVITNRRFFGDQYCHQFCLALLPSYPAGIKHYEKLFKRLSPFEKNRIAALNHERQGSILKAYKPWLLCCYILEQHPQAQEDSRLKAALILRNLVEFTEKRGETFEDDDVPNYLEKSLFFDPDDKITYLKLIHWYKKTDDFKNYHKWIENALKHFPKDSDILLAGMESATSKKAFKKASKFAKILLKVDPINVKARQIARSSHISHARKLIKAGKYPLARKELEEAACFEKSNLRSGIVQINQALLELQAEGYIKPIKRKSTSKSQAPRNRRKATESNPQILKLLQEGVELAGSGVATPSICGQFRVIVESKYQSLDSDKILFFLGTPPKKDYLPSRQEVNELLSMINSYSEEGATFLSEAVKQLDPTLKKLLKVAFSQEEFIGLCECFKKLEHYDLLKQFAEQALKRWSKQPAFVFYHIYGKAKGFLWQLSMPDINLLHQAIEDAEQQGDKRITVMIINFLNKSEGELLQLPIIDSLDDNDDDDPFKDLTPLEVNEKNSEEQKDINDQLEDLKNLDLDNINPVKLINIIKRLEALGIDLPRDLNTPYPLPRPKNKPKKR